VEHDVNPDPSSERAPQLAYSLIQDKTHDEARRRRKAAKVVAVLRHFLGRDDLTGLVALDAGCSTGFLADVLRGAGCDVIGIDIDQPGLAHAHARFGERVRFLCADGGAMPLADGSVDLVVFNQVYEHVVDADAVMAEIRRVLSPHGVVFFGLGNKYQVMEPHYRLPFLSWVPPRMADAYVAAFGRADDYYERFRSRRGLLRMCRGLSIWDYTYAVLGDATAFDATDVVPRRLSRAPSVFWRSLQPIMPTFVWVGTPGEDVPRGPKVRVEPRRIAG
jgi:SAM-dependent methyltransferase